MKIYNIVGLIVSLIVAFICYFATSNIFVGVGVLITFIAFYFLIIYKKINSYKQEVRKLHECYLFVNNFLVSLSIKESVVAAFDATRTSISDEYSEYISSIEELNPQEKLLYLNKYFTFHIYQLFVDIVLLWMDEGGRILDMSQHIINEVREIEEYVTYCQSINRRKAIEIGTLWLFSLTIAVALRLALGSFFSTILNSPIFIVSICALALLVLISIFFLVSRVTHLEVRRTANG